MTAPPWGGPALLVVPTERHVERAAQSGQRATTRGRLRDALHGALGPPVRVAGPEATRMALWDAAREALRDEPRFASLAERSGEAAMLRVMDALDDAMGALRAAGVDAEDLARVEATAGDRARWLRLTLLALDAALATRGLVDGRTLGTRLARVLARAEPEEVARAAGARHLRARLVLRWDPADVAWWRAMDAALSGAGGRAVVELPGFDKPIDAARERDPLDALLDDLALRLDEAPETGLVTPVLGDLTLLGDVPPATRERVTVRRAMNAGAQARAAAQAVRAAIAAGCATDRVAIVVPRIDEATLAPLRRLLDEGGVPTFDVRGPAPLASGLVSIALDVLGLAPALPRERVARVLRSRYVNARKLTGVDDARLARGLLDVLATVLERTPTARGDDPVGRLVATAEAARGPWEDAAAREQRAELARRVGSTCMLAECTQSRAAHARAARALWEAFGLGPGPGTLTRTWLAQDEPPRGIARAELQSVARDAHAWEVLGDALDAVERAAREVGGLPGDTPCTAATFRHELGRALEGGVPPPPAGRLGAVRIGRFGDVAGDALDLLVVLDAEDGAIPSAAEHGDLLPESLVRALAEHDPLRAPVPRAVLEGRDLAGLALAVSAAVRVVVVYKLRDATGAPLAPAPLVAWLERGGVASAVAHASPLLGGAATPGERTLALLAQSPERAPDLDPAAARVAATELERERWHASFERPSEACGDLRDDPALRAVLEAETGGGSRPLSVTALERLARCPFQGFATQVLGAREAEAATDTPDRREEGTLVHDALRAAFEATRALWPSRPRDASAILAGAAAAVDAVLAASGQPMRDATLARIRDEAMRVVTLEIAEEEWDFALAEQAFGEGSDAWPAWTIGEGAARVSLRGRIDRIDAAHLRAAVRVVDYKHRASAGTGTDVGQTTLQVPVYAQVAAAHLGVPEHEGAYVLTVNPERTAYPGFSKRYRELFQVEDGATRLERRVLEVTQRVRHGFVAPRPHAPGTCTHCALDGACRRPRFAIGTPEDDE